MSFGGYLRADTQTNVTIGPVVSVGDGFTPVTTLDLSTADEAEIIKHSGASVWPIHTYTMTAIVNASGYYYMVLPDTILDTEGRLTVLINDDSLCLPVRMDFEVVNANVYDSLYAAATTDYLQVDVEQLDGDSAAAASLNSACDNYSATRGLAGTALPAAAADAAGGLPVSDAGGLDMDTYLQRITGDAALASVCTEARLSELDAGTGGKMANQVDIIQTDTTTDIPATIATAQADLDLLTGADGATLATVQGNYAPSKTGDAMALTAGAVDDIWDEDVDTSHQVAGSAGKKLDDAGGAADPWATALPGAYGAGTAGKIMGDNIDAPISTVDTVVDSIKTQLDTEFLAIKGATWNGSTDSLEAIRDRGDAAWTTGTGGTAGSGAITFTYTLTDADSGDPIPGADVWATTDVGGSNVVASGVTDSFGEVVFYLDAGTYYIWRQLSGYNFVNPDTEVVA